MSWFPRARPYLICCRVGWKHQGARPLKCLLIGVKISTHVQGRASGTHCFYCSWLNALGLGLDRRVIWPSFDLEDDVVHDVALLAVIYVLLSY
jgi:hypothetical protein